MLKSILTTVAGIVLGLLALFVGAAASWGYYSTGSAHQWAIALNWPTFLARLILPTNVAEGVSISLALGLNFAFYIGLAWVIRFGLQRLRRVVT